MGQLVQKDSRPQLQSEICQQNVRPFNQKSNFIVCPFLEFQKCSNIFFIENQDEFETLYKFGSSYTVHLQLKKQKAKQMNGIYMKMAEDYVYAYKHRKLDRSDQIKPEKLLFKKRIYVQQLQSQTKKIVSSQKREKHRMGNLQILLLKFAQIKLLSLLQIGAKLGRVYNGCDGIVTSEYIEYFSQITIDRIENCIPKNSQLKQLQNKLIQCKIFHQGLLKNQNLSYSRWKKGYVLKQLHYHEKGIKSESQASYENQSIHYVIRQFETQVTKAIMDLDNQAKMLPFINNLIFQHDFQKALSKFQQSLPLIQDEQQRFQYAESISSMISKHSNSNSRSRQYEKRIQKIMSVSTNNIVSNHSLNSVTSQRNKTTSISISLPQTVSKKSLLQNQKSVGQQEQIAMDSPFSQDKLNIQALLEQNFQMNQNVNDSQQKKITQFGLPEPEIKGIIKFKVGSSQKQRHFLQMCKNLKNSILDKNNEKIREVLQLMKNLQYKSVFEIQIIFGKILMENARSRHALTIFQKILLFSNEAPSSEIYLYQQIALLAGIMYFHRYSYRKSLKAFQKALSILLKIRHYSIKMMAIFNNISCIHHVLQDYDTSILNLHRGFRIGQYSVDYQYLMRSNMAMALAQKGKIKQAKSQMLKINKIVQPVNNMVIFCKFYSNLAYLQMQQTAQSKTFDKAVANFQQACNVEEKYLIPNGYRPSIFLHNNMAILHYKRKQFKKAKLHCEKITNQLNDVEGMVAVKVHFNIGKIFSQGYNYDLPLKHFQEARVLLSKMDQTKQPSLRKYKETFNREIEELQKMRIDEVSEQESYKFSYLSSSLLKKV